MPSCAVQYCIHVRDKKSPGVSFHGFPNCPKRKKLWVKAIQIRRGPLWVPKLRTKICSLHFEDDCFNYNLQRRTLKEQAIPTINLECKRKDGSKNVDNLITCTYDINEETNLNPNLSTSDTDDENEETFKLTTKLQVVLDNIEQIPVQFTKAQLNLLRHQIEHQKDEPIIIQAEIQTKQITQV